MRRALAFLAIVAVVPALPACSTSSSGLSIEITAGQEMDAFTKSPAVTTVTIAMTSLDGNINVTKTAAPGGTFDFGEIDDTEQVSINVSGAAAGSNTAVMTGASLSGLLLSSVVGAVPIFIQRTEQWSRPPGALACAHVNGIATVLADRFIIVTGGTNAMAAPSTCNATGVDGYDIFGLTGNESVTPFSPVPDTMVSLLPTDTDEDTQVLLISAGNGVTYDYSSGDVTTLDAPTGITWAGVAGGTVVTATDGRIFVVGAGRRTPPTTKDVLEIDTDGTLGGFTLSTARLGAAVTWVDGTGLAVAGGSPTGPGLEVLGSTATQFASINYPPDPVVGAGAVTGGSNSVVLFGGLDGTTQSHARQLSTDCSAVTCTPAMIDDSALPALTNVSAYQLAAQRDIIVGDDPTTHENLTFVIDYAGGLVQVKPMLLREPRLGATAIPAPNGTLALIGGQHLDATGTPALSIELFAP